MKNTQETSELIDAVLKEKDLETIDKLIKDKHDLNYQNQYGNTALIFAAKKGLENVVNALVDARANVDLKDDTGNTALIIAAEKKFKPKILSKLIDITANKKQQNKDGNTALIILANQNNTEMAVRLIKDTEFLDAQDKNGDTALIIAVKNRNVDIVRALLEKGAGVHFKNKINETALSIASQTGVAVLDEALLGDLDKHLLQPADSREKNQVITDLLLEYLKPDYPRNNAAAKDYSVTPPVSTPGSKGRYLSGRNIYK